MAEVNDVRSVFRSAEPRDLFYKVAGPLIAKAWNDPTVTPTVGESLAILLLSWNASYYRFRPAPPDHIDQIEALITRHRGVLERYRGRRLALLAADEQESVAHLFSAFEGVVGLVGAAKALHLLAPGFFPIWDRRIAEAYGVDLLAAGSKGAAYAAFMNVVAGECADLAEVDGVPDDVVKLLDEINYVTITLEALREERERRAAKRHDRQPGAGT